MKISKTILCVTVLAITTLFSSCQKNQSNTCSADLYLSFETTDDFQKLVTRQVEVTLEGQTYSTTTIEGASFSKTVTIPNISAPATIDVKVSATRIAKELPASYKFKNTYEIKCTVGNAFLKNSEQFPEFTLKPEDFEEFLDDLNYTVRFNLKEDGSISH